jgi:flagellar biosynthesis/type III secretory pathway protein FliH
VRWLVAEAEIEQRVLASLRPHLHAWLLDAVRSIVSGVDIEARVADHVARTFAEVGRPQRLTLRLSPGTRDRVLAALSSFDLALECHDDATLGPGEAMLESDFVLCRVDVFRHLDGVLGALCESLHPPGPERPAVRRSGDKV